jgi:phosphohistidine phosphatase SixA
MSLTLLRALAVVGSSALLASLLPAQHDAHRAHHQQAGDTTTGVQFLHARPDAYLLADQLRTGGLIILMRHAKTDVNGVDVFPFDYTNCRRQRNLSPAGRALTREVANTWRFLGIRVDAAVSSPYCRVIETARLLVPTARANDSLAVQAPRESNGARLLGVMQARRPTAGRNLLVMSHVLSIAQAFNLQLQEGEALILRPGTDGGAPTVLGRLGAIEWGDIHRDWKSNGGAATMEAAHRLHHR